jgi:hypothetical protein
LAADHDQNAEMNWQLSPGKWWQLNRRRGITSAANGRR